MIRLLYLPFLLLMSSYQFSIVFAQEESEHKPLNDLNSFDYHRYFLNLFRDLNSQQSYSPLSISQNDNKPVQKTCSPFVENGEINHCKVPVYNLNKDICIYLDKDIEPSDNPCKIAKCDPATGDTVYEDDPSYCFIPTNRSGYSYNKITTVDYGFKKLYDCRSVNNQCIATLYETICKPTDENYYCEGVNNICYCSKKDGWFYYLDSKNIYNSIAFNNNLKKITFFEHKSDNMVHFIDQYGDKCSLKLCCDESKQVESEYYFFNVKLDENGHEKDVKAFYSFGDGKKITNNADIDEYYYTRYCNSLDPEFECNYDYSNNNCECQRIYF